MIEPFDPLAPELLVDANAVYARYRDAGPVHHGASPDPRFPSAWYVFGFAEVIEIARNPAMRNDPRLFIPPGGPPAPPDPPRLSTTDPPDHTRIRTVLNRAFSPARVEALRPQVRATCDALLDELAGRGPIDLVADFAFQVPVRTIAAVLGVSPEDHDHFRRWSDDMMAGFDIAGDLGTLERAQGAIARFDAYFVAEIERRRGAPPRDDLLGQLLVLTGDEGALAPEEVPEIARFLVIAGFETTMNLIGTGLYELWRRPDQVALLAGDPDGCTPGAVEELLRHISPVQRLMARYPIEDVEVAGSAIPAGAPIHLMVGAANRDPLEFPDPDEVDVTRRPRRNLAFGFGRHVCVGAGLARLEAEEAIKAVLARPGLVTPHLDEAVWRAMFLTRGLERFPAEA